MEIVVEVDADLYLTSFRNNFIVTFVKQNLFINFDQGLHQSLSL